MLPKWLVWARKLHSLAQSGLTYSNNPFDRERYEEINHLAAEIAAEGAAENIRRVQGLFEGEEGYVTPKLDARAAAFRDGKILLVREVLDGGRWTLPGGWIDPGDSPSEAALRELREETGYEGCVLHLAAVLDRDRNGHPRYFYAIYKLFFVCEITGGQPAQSIETGESAFFAEDALPELSIARVTPREIALMFEHYRNPGLPTVFD